MENPERPEITDLTHFQRYGINYLTGESCAFGLRVLCDVSQKGKELLEEYLGCELKLADRMNPDFGYEGERQKSVGSIMLTGAMLKDLAVFIMFYVEGMDAVAYKPDRLQVYGIMAGDTHRGADVTERYASIGYEVRRNIRGGGGQPYRESRNVHAMTQRSH